MSGQRRIVGARPDLAVSIGEAEVRHSLADLWAERVDVNQVRAGCALTDVANGSARRAAARGVALMRAMLPWVEVTSYS